MRRIRTENKNTEQEWDKLYMDPEVATRWTQWFDGSFVEAISSHLPKGAKILDVGCGVGFSEYVLQRMLNRTDLSFYGVDSSMKAVEYLRRHSSVIWEGILHWNACNSLPFREKSFDVAMACEIIEHLEEPSKLLDELFRVGKRVIITVPNRMEVDTEYHVWELTEDDVKALLSVYGKPNVFLARNNQQIVGVC